MHSIHTYTQLARKNILFGLVGIKTKKNTHKIERKPNSKSHEYHSFKLYYSLFSINIV